MEQFENHKLTEAQKVVLALFLVIFFAGIVVIPLVIIINSVQK